VILTEFPFWHFPKFLIAVSKPTVLAMLTFPILVKNAPLCLTDKEIKLGRAHLVVARLFVYPNSSMLQHTGTKTFSHSLHFLCDFTSLRFIKSEKHHQVITDKKEILMFQDFQ